MENKKDIIPEEELKLEGEITDDDAAEAAGGRVVTAVCRTDPGFAKTMPIRKGTVPGDGSGPVARLL